MSDRLDRRQPDREGAGVVLDQAADEALHRAEQRAVDHHRAVALAVLADVVDVEALGQVEVDLDRRTRPLAAEGVDPLDVDLRAVERAAALVDLVGEPARVQRLPQSRSVARSQVSSSPIAFSGRVAR